MVEFAGISRTTRHKFCGEFAAVSDLVQNQRRLPQTWKIAKNYDTEFEYRKTRHKMNSAMTESSPQTQFW